MSDKSIQYPDVSIIIPMYNAKEYIHDCVKNICAISAINSNIEAIFIDDASTDNSFHNVQEYQKENPFIKVLRLDMNSGPGIARNRGVDCAKGLYIVFLDIDDALYPVAFNELLVFAKKQNKEIVAYDTDIIDINGDMRQRKDLNIVNKDKETKIRSFLRTDMDGSVIFTLFKKSFLENNHLTFSSGIHEDIPVIFKAYFYSNKISVFAKPVYKKISKITSIVHTISAAHIEGVFKSYLTVLHFLKSRGYHLDEYKDDIRFGFTGFVATLSLKIKFSFLTLDEKLVLTRYLSDLLYDHNWIFFGEYSNRTTKDNVVKLFVKYFHTNRRTVDLESYLAFDEALTTVLGQKKIPTTIRPQAKQKL